MNLKYGDSIKHEHVHLQPK